MDRRVVITGHGWITPLGHSSEEVWGKMLDGQSGVGPTTRFNASTFPTNFCAEVKDFDLANFLGDKAEIHSTASLNAQFALAAAEQAWHAARLHDFRALDRTRAGIYLGGGEGTLDFDQCAIASLDGCLDDERNIVPLDTVRWAKRAMKVLSAVKELEQEPNLTGGHLASHFQIQGPSFNTLTACAASTQALGEATRIIRYGDADVMISGGTHSMIHTLGVTGFNRLTALSTRNDTCLTASRPFDRTRDGFVIGEGAGILILEELTHALDRGAPILGEIAGYGSTADAFRITDIHEEGRGAIAAMKRAMDSAGLTPADVDYISAHGTSTEENDKIETLAIRTLFGEHAKTVCISSIKSMVGHLIAAAGAVELITCLLAIRDGAAPPTINYENPDPNCDLNYTPNQAKKMPIRVALSNSFGFGGQNDALIVRAFEG